MRSNSPDDKLVEFSIGEDHLSAAGQALLAYNKINEAIELFNLMVEEFPLSANAYHSLGEAYMRASNKELAIENYE